MNCPGYPEHGLVIGTEVFWWSHQLHRLDIVSRTTVGLHTPQLFTALFVTCPIVEGSIRNKVVLLFVVLSLVAFAGCAGPADTDDNGQSDTAINPDDDGRNGHPESKTSRSASTQNDTERDGESPPKTKKPLSTATPPDTDDRTDSGEDNASNLDPTYREVRVVKGSPQAGWANETLRAETLGAVEFLAELPQNRTQRNRTVTDAATTICNAHDRVVPATASNASKSGQTAYRNTYRVAHAAKTMHDLGADVDVAAIQGRMQMAREYSGLAAKYTPVIGSYQRLHNASCAVKRGDPGATEDFYIASAEFAVDLALAQHGVIYKASFKTTGMAAQAIGMSRLARVCGYKCVGLVQSEVHWLVRGTYSGALDTVSQEAIDGNLTVDGWNQSTRGEVGEYLENRTDSTLVGTDLVSDTKVRNCVTENLDDGDLLKFTGTFSKDAMSTLKTILAEQQLPEDGDLSFLTKIGSVNKCLNA